MNGVHCHTSAAIDRRHREGRHPVDGRALLGAEQLPDPVQDAVEQAVVGVVERVLPQQRRGHRHHQERRDQQGAGEAAAGELPVEQHRQAKPEQQAEDHDRGGQHDRVDHRVPQPGVGEDGAVVGEPGERRVVAHPEEALLPGLEHVPVQRGDRDRQQERDLGDEDREDQRRQQRAAPAPPLRAGHGAGRPAGALWAVAVGASMVPGRSWFLRGCGWCRVVPEPAWGGRTSPPPAPAVRGLLLVLLGDAPRRGSGPCRARRRRCRVRRWPRRCPGTPWCRGPGTPGCRRTGRRRWAAAARPGSPGWPPRSTSASCSPKAAAAFLYSGIS